MGVGFSHMIEFNIAVFTFWFCVEYFNPGVYNMGFFCNICFFQVDFYEAAGGTYVNKIKIFV